MSMGVYIKGIEIPTDNTVLIRVFPVSENGECYVQQLDVDGDILDELWAVPVPPHGDLIDRDAMIADIQKNVAPTQYIKDRNSNIIYFLRHREAIIPAEEGET